MATVDLVVRLGEPADPGSDAAEACRNKVSDSRFRHGCKVYLGAPAVWVGQSGGNRIRHNEFIGQFMWAVSLGWNWSYFPLNRSRDNAVEKNHVHDLGTGVLGTHGALYCLGVSPGTVLRHHDIHHVHAAEAWGAGEGMILDNASSIYLPPPAASSLIIGRVVWAGASAGKPAESPRFFLYTFT